MRNHIAELRQGVEGMQAQIAAKSDERALVQVELTGITALYRAPAGICSTLMLGQLYADPGITWNVIRDAAAAVLAEIKGFFAARKRNPELWVTFADNHDVERVYARGTPRAARQCLAAYSRCPVFPACTMGRKPVSPGRALRG